MNASSQVFLALPQLTVQPAVVLAAVPVVRVNDPVTPTSEIAELAWTFVVPGVEEVITTVQFDDPTARKSVEQGERTNDPVVLLARIVAVAVPAATVPVAGFEFTVIVNV